MVPQLKFLHTAQVSLGFLAATLLGLLLHTLVQLVLLRRIRGSLQHLLGYPLVFVNPGALAMVGTSAQVLAKPTVTAI